MLLNRTKTKERGPIQHLPPALVPRWGGGGGGGHDFACTSEGLVSYQKKSRRENWIKIKRRQGDILLCGILAHVSVSVVSKISAV